MKLRKLENKDAQYMLEWMHDDSVVHFMGRDFSKNTIEDCINFIVSSQDDGENLHMAIANELDEYMGTVSLKHVNYDLSMAEFAITVRKCAMGKGYSIYGLNEIIKYAFSILKLKQIVWCVSKKNERAVRFYDKNCFDRVQDIPEEFRKYYSSMEPNELIWYCVEQGNDNE